MDRIYIADVESKTAKSDDGTNIAYETLGQGDSWLVLANGLGGRLYTWKPIVDHFRERYKILTWDYRGLFKSEEPTIRRHMNIPYHAHDLHAILEQEGIEQATLIGWSMGVQVSLEFTTLYPERVRDLVLINGTHGHTLETGFQPIFRLPWFSRLLNRVIEEAQERPNLVEFVSKLAMTRLNVEGIGGLLARLFRNPAIAPAYRQYLTDLFSDGNFKNYLHLFQELNGHSVLHHLKGISQRTLLISGLLDVLTPAYQSFEIARRLKNVEHLHLPFGTHFVLLEYPQLTVQHIERFITGGKA